jgi:hypothetical protein
LLFAGTGTDALIASQRTLILDHARNELKKNWQFVKQGETFFLRCVQMGVRRFVDFH